MYLLTCYKQKLTTAQFATIHVHNGCEWCRSMHEFWFIVVYEGNIITCFVALPFLCFEYHHRVCCSTPPTFIWFKCRHMVCGLLPSPFWALNVITYFFSTQPFCASNIVASSVSGLLQPLCVLNSCPLVNPINNIVDEFRVLTAAIYKHYRFGLW